MNSNGLSAEDGLRYRGKQGGGEEGGEGKGAGGSNHASR